MLRIWRCDCALCVIGNEFPCRQPHNPSATLLRGPSTLPKDKNRSPFHGEKPLMIKYFLGKKSIKFLKTITNILVGTWYFTSASNGWYSIWYYNYGRTWSITSLPGLVFRRRRAVFILLAMPPPSLWRAALVMWCGWFKLRLEIRHATALTTGAKHWHR